MALDNAFSSDPGKRRPVLRSPEEEIGRVAVVRLPNAMVGREFAVELEEYFPSPGVVSDLPAGLEVSEGVLRGTPEEAGEFEMTVQVGPGESALMAVTINADPRSLWKNLPSDRDAPFWKPDTATEYLDDGPLTVVGASLRGRSHAHVGSFRDDDLALAWFPGSSWYSLSVADGAGSATYSRQGSKIACDSVKRHFTDYFADPGNALSQLVAEPEASQALRGELYQQFGKAAVAARKAIEDQAASLSAATRDFHTTLITVLLHPLPDGNWFVAAFSIGDGAAAVVSQTSEVCLLTRPDGGDYAGQTVFLTMNEALATSEAVMARIQTAVIPHFDALILITDGVSDPRFESETALADPAAWQEIWTELRILLANADSRQSAAAAILKWMEFHAPGHHDDRTLVLATPSLTFPAS